MGLFRLLLALSVVQAHFWHRSIFFGLGGSTSVELFFVISGYYIAKILDTRYSSVKSFYMNRALRLYPTYAIVMFLILLKLIALPHTRDNLFDFSPVILFLGTLGNLTFFTSDWVMFFKQVDGHVVLGNFQLSETPLWHVLWVPQIWSLGIEVMFYLFAPLICKQKSKTLFIGLILLFAARALGYLAGANYDPWTYRFFPFELPLFILGIFLHRNQERLVSFISKFPTNINYLRNITYAMLILSFIVIGTIDVDSELKRVSILLFMLVITTLVVAIPNWGKLDRFVGELSYPIYICHMFIAALISYTLDRPLRRILGGSEYLQSPLGNLLAVFSVVLFAVILCFLVRPIEKIRDKVRK